MTFQARDRRALAFLAVSAILTLVYRYWPTGAAPVVAVTPADSVSFAEKRLARLRDTAAAVPAKEDVMKKVSAELATREKGLIVADTAAQAQAQLIQIIRGLGSAEAPPIEIRATELGPIRQFGDAYGEAGVSVQIECRIDQLVNLLAGLASQPELVSTTDLRVMSGNVKDKTVGARLTVVGIVPRKLIPEKRTNTGATGF
jgi:type II secretion system (T2SS) protein M